MEEMISEKNDREDGSSSCSNSVRCQLHPGLGINKREHTLRVLIAQCTLSHVSQLDSAF